MMQKQMDVILPERDGIEVTPATDAQHIFRVGADGAWLLDGSLITAIREAIAARHEVVVVVVPDQVLFGQWYKELDETMVDLHVRILRAGAGYNSWRENLQLWTSPGDQPRIVVATVQTAATDDFRQRLAAVAEPARACYAPSAQGGPCRRAVGPANHRAGREHHRGRGRLRRGLRGGGLLRGLAGLGHMPSSVSD